MLMLYLLVVGLVFFPRGLFSHEKEEVVAITLHTVRFYRCGFDRTYLRCPAFCSADTCTMSFLRAGSGGN